MRETQGEAEKQTKSGRDTERNIYTDIDIMSVCVCVFRGSNALEKVICRRRGSQAESLAIDIDIFETFNK